MSVICVGAVCGNEQCEQYDQDVLAEVDLRELPDGGGYVEGEYGVCEHCREAVYVTLDPNDDYSDPDAWRDERMSEW